MYTGIVLDTSIPTPFPSLDPLSSCPTVDLDGDGSPRVEGVDI